MTGGACPEAAALSNLDAAVATVAEATGTWAAVGTAERVELLEELQGTFSQVADHWVTTCQEIEGTTGDAAARGEEWLAGPYLVLRNLRFLARSLRDLRRHGAPRPPAPPRTLPDGRLAVPVVPAEWSDRLFFPGVTAQVWMAEGVTAENLPQHQARAYRRPDGGGVALVLGAGNVSSIGPLDALYKLFVDNRAVVYKTHPVNRALGPLLTSAFEPLGRRGFFRVVDGGAREGEYLCRHPQVDEIHITGSDRTYEAIVFGPGPEGAARRQARQPLLDKPVSAELGNVSPVIVVPGPWSEGDLGYQAENLAAMLTNNGGFNCNAARVILQHQDWPLRQPLLHALRRVLARVPPRRAWYPGAEERFARFTQAHPEAERFGDAAPGELPWALVPGVDPEAEDDPCFRVEAFCGLFAETALAAPGPAEFLAAAVDFCNRRLWGTLNATLLVHPASLADPALAAAVERAIADLRYGTVAINCWAAVGYGLATTPWGAYPGHPPWDIQSGAGVVHNTLMFDAAEKSVVRAPFRAFPKPPWFTSHGTGDLLARELTRFEGDRSLLRLPAVTWFALRG
jgi:hypothetical protein